MMIFVTGGTGYIGRAVIPELLHRGHRVRCLVRSGSEGKLPPNTESVTGDALDGSTFATAIGPADTFLQLVGTPNPSPRYAAEFERVDLASVRESSQAAKTAGVAHFVYVSVAHPAPLMQAYIDARMRGEELVRATGIPATILRPWYVLGPRHRWPYLLLPVYGAMWLMPSRRDTVQRLGLITLGIMVRALVAAIEHPAETGVRVWDVPALREVGRQA